MANEKKTLDHTTEDVAIDLGPFKFRRTRKWLNFTALAAIAVSNAAALKPFHRGPVDIAAAAEQTSFDFREVTGEDILALTERTGGTVDSIVRDKSGLITEIRASIPTAFEYDTDEMSEVLESLQATGVTPKKLLGDLAQTSVGVNISFTGTTTAESADVTAVSSMSGLSIGLTVTGAGVPANTTITALGANTVTLSNEATAAGASVALTAVGATQVIGLADWTIDWKRKTADSTTTDDAEYAGNTGSTKSWTVKANYMFIDGDTSQSAYIVEALSNTDDGVQTWNFFPTVEQGRTAFQGKAIIDGITWASGIGKVLGMNISLTGTGPLLVLAQSAPVVNPNTVTGESAQV